MGRRILFEARFRLIVGVIAAATAPLWLPSIPSDRLWALAAAVAVAPWLVIGRDLRRRANGFRAALQIAPRAGRWVMLEMAPPLAVVALSAILGTGGRWAPAIALTVWGAAVTCLADGLDRRCTRPGSAWVVSWVVILAVWTSPLWLGAWFGTTEHAPWVSTLAVGLHPTAIALNAAGLATLQDPWFYGVTLGGVVESYALDWRWGAAGYALIAAAAIGWDVRVARRAPR